MALIYIREKARRSGSGDEKAVREYMRSWDILRDSMLDDSYVVLTTPGLPHMFDLYVGADGKADPLGALCRKLDARQPDPVDNPFLWEVDAHYSNKTDQPELGNPNPLLRPSEVEWDWVSSTRVLERALDGAAVVNSAGEKFDPPVEVDDYRLLLRITRNESAYGPNVALIYKDAVNSDPFLGAPAGFCKMRPIKAKRNFENNVFYYSVTYEIAFRGVNDPPWQPTVLDAGFYESVKGKQVAIFDESTGQPLQGPALLNGLGRKISKAVTNLTAAIGANDGQIAVGSADGFPATFPYTILVDAELMSVTGTAGGVASAWVVTRGMFNTTKAAHANNAQVTLQPVFLTFKGYNTAPYGPLKLP